MRSSILMLGTVILLAGCGDGGLGGFPQVYPEAPAGKKFVDVLGAAEAVVKEHYPMASTAIRSQHVLSLSKVGLLGGAKSLMKFYFSSEVFEKLWQAFCAFADNKNSAGAESAENLA